MRTFALDFSKAFDTVMHSKLLSNLAKLDTPGMAYNWIRVFWQTFPLYQVCWIGFDTGRYIGKHCAGISYWSGHLQCLRIRPATYPSRKQAFQVRWRYLPYSTQRQFKHLQDRITPCNELGHRKQSQTQPVKVNGVSDHSSPYLRSTHSFTAASNNHRHRTSE